MASIPELHDAAAILTLRNGAFEIAVIQRMVLYFDRQPLVVRIERGAARDRPGFEHTVEFQPQIVMQLLGGMLLDPEPPPLRRRDLGLAAGLGGLFEIPFLSIDGEVLGSHESI